MLTLFGEAVEEVTQGDCTTCGASTHGRGSRVIRLLLVADALARVFPCAKVAKGYCVAPSPLSVQLSSLYHVVICRRHPSQLRHRLVNNAPVRPIIKEGLAHHIGQKLTPSTDPSPT